VSNPIKAIYGVPLSPFSMRIEMMLVAKGSDLRLTPPADGVHSPSYRQLAPIGKVPAMQLSDGRVFGESEVIAAYIEDALPGPALLPASAVDRAEARLAARTADLYIMNRMLPLFKQLDPAARDQQVVDTVIGEMREGLLWLEQQVAVARPGHDSPYAAAAMVPIIFYVLRFLPMFDVPDVLADMPSLAALYDRLHKSEPGAGIVAAMHSALAEVGL